MKQEKVIERVYNPRRLRKAWRQIKENAGAAGIDQMTVEEFEKREEELLKAHPREAKRGNLPFQTCAKGADSEGRHFQDAETGDTGGYGSDSRPRVSIWCLKRYSIRSLRGPTLGFAEGEANTRPLDMFRRWWGRGTSGVHPLT